MSKVIQTDVLIIGSGGAGLRTAIELFDRKINCVVVGKCKKREAHTSWARGGINAALGSLDREDSWQLHAADTIKDGGHINDTDAVITLTKNGKRAIKELVSYGVPFNRTKGKITQRFFGAATYRRACFVGDHTGLAILNKLVDQVVKRNIPFKSELYITSLLTSDGKVNGALGLDMKTGKHVVFHCKAVVIATGGHSRMFKRSSSHFWENNGDGIALGAAVGAKCMDMELFQFHPTGMVWPKKLDGILVTEAVRGEGGQLFNSNNERFMQKYDPERMELSARDVVARAIYHEIQQGRGTKHEGVWLDITHRPLSYLKKRLPVMVKQFKDVGVDISKQRMEITPTAHYSMGGLLVDHNTGKTTIENLFAVGEVTSGVHGANRLGGNSLLELIVFGRITGEYISKHIKKKKMLDLDLHQLASKEDALFGLVGTKKGKNPILMKKQLQEEMWEACGVERNSKCLNAGLKALKKYEKMKFKVPSSTKMNEKLIALLDLQNMLPVCEMMLKSALMRKETRAAHYRSDFPKTKPSWKKNIICTPGKNGSIKFSTQKVKPVPAQIRKLFKMKRGYHYLE